jgi:hypothetical protein
MSLQDRIYGLSPEKRSRLERQLLERRAERVDASSSALPRRKPGDATPLSFAQQQLWFLDQWEPGGSAYNASLNFRFDGSLDVDCLQRSFDTIVLRHETLRTVVIDNDGVPVARILEGVAATLVKVDLISHGASVPKDALTCAVRDIVQAPFDLAKDLPMRVGLIRVGEFSHVICMVMHHIACDGWSRGILFDELSILYNAYLNGEPSPLPDLPVQYGDYALWQQGWLQGDVLKGEVDFWREELSGTDLVLDLPSDHPRPTVLEFEGARIALTVPAATADALRRVGRTERATMYMVLHGVTAAALHGLTGQTDFLLGSPVVNRRWPETEALIGFFVNTLVLRARMKGDPSFRELIGRCRDTAVRCYGHQELPFERLVQALRPKRRSDRNPLFQVNLRVQGPAPEPPVLTGLVASKVSVGLESSRFDLAFGFNDAPGDLTGYIEYNLALFDRATILRWIRGFVDMLERVAADPELRLSELVEPMRRAARSDSVLR